LDANRGGSDGVNQTHGVTAGAAIGIVASAFSIHSHMPHMSQVCLLLFAPAAKSYQVQRIHWQAFASALSLDLRYTTGATLSADA
jgi:hypothetical protein